MLSLFTPLVIVWGAVTAILIVLLIYRALVSMKEEDQLFLDPSEAGHAREQEQFIGRLNRLSTYTKGCTAASLVLLLVIAGLWVYQNLNAPPIR